MTNEFSLMSINVIAYLRMKGIDPLRAERNETGSVVHFFEDTDELHFYLKEYKRDKHLQSFITQLANTRNTIKQLNN